MKPVLTVNPDEFSQDIHISLPFVRQIGVNHIELRSLSGKNILDFTNEEATQLAKLLKKEGISVAALASPLFKWYVSDNSPEILFDHFFFEPRISTEHKKHYITRAIEIAEIFECPIVRVFSYLTDPTFSLSDFQNDELIHFAIEEARKKGIKLALENEPICTVQTKNDIATTMNHFSDTLGLFYDISNFSYVGTHITKDDVLALEKRIFYVQCKNFQLNPEFHYVPLDNGHLNYVDIMGWFEEIYPKDAEMFINIETHIKENKTQVIRDSFRYLGDILHKPN